MNILQLYQDYNIPYATEEHRHYQTGWINTACPYCRGNEGMHLGYNLENDYMHCWRCGAHKTIDTIAILIGVAPTEAKQIIRNYKGHTKIKSPEPKVIIRKKAFRLPSDIIPMQNYHRNYLIKRGFDPDQLEHTWGLLGSGPAAKLDDINYKLRIIIPITWDDRMVSFTSRDITNKQRLKYVTCPKDRELVHHKEILYGRQDKWTDTGICVEGPADVWRFGIHAFATFGIQYTYTQLRLIAKSFKQVVVIYDDDPQATVQAEKLVSELKFRGVDAEWIGIQGDPGGMKQDDADYLVKTIIK